MVHLNFPKLSALFAYDLTSVAYKPTPSSSLAVVLSSTPSHSNASSVQITQVSSTLSRAANSYRRVRRSSKKPKHVPTSDTSDAGCDVEPYNAPPVGNQDFQQYDQTTANVYRYRQQQSVNLGSWFVHEDWMTPSLFKCASGTKGAEIDIAQGWGSIDSARSVLERHWDTFIQASDFEYLANIGINTVRLPIGYWNLGPDYIQGTPFESVAQVYRNCWPRVVRAINQAGNAGLGVLIDLHGAVGSQNGQQHSGVSDGQTNLFTVPKNMDMTIALLTFLAKELAPVNNVVGIQILNEPKYGSELENFYTRAIEAIRLTSPLAKKLPLYLHDGFDLGRFSHFMAARKDFVVQDHHSYFVFTPSDQKESGTQHTLDVEGAIADSLNRVAAKQRRNLVVDEWSAALTPESMTEDNDNAENIRKQFALEQIKVYSNATAGWSFWSYKKEDCDDDPGWCFKAAVGKSLPETFFSYGKPTSMKEANVLAKDASNLIIPTISTDILNLVPHLAYQASRLTSNLRSSFFNPLGLRAVALPHRFEAIYRQRDAEMDQAHQDSSARGYKDGFTTAKVFAGYNMSMLGFVGQFIADAIEVAGPALIVQGTEEGYGTGFMQGLVHGQDAAIGGK